MCNIKKLCQLIKAFVYYCQGRKTEYVNTLLGNSPDYDVDDDVLDLFD